MQSRQFKEEKFEEFNIYSIFSVPSTVYIPSYLLHKLLWLCFLVSTETLILVKFTPSLDTYDFHYKW